MNEHKKGVVPVLWNNPIGYHMLLLTMMLHSIVLLW